MWLRQEFPVQRMRTLGFMGNEVEWVMVSAGLLRGKRATAVWNIHVDLANAGATVLNEPCVVDGNLITARFPYDLPRMIQALVQQLVR